MRDAEEAAVSGYFLFRSSGGPECHRPLDLQIGHAGSVFCIHSLALIATRSLKLILSRSPQDKRNQNADANGHTEAHVQTQKPAISSQGNLDTKDVDDYVTSRGSTGWAMLRGCAQISKSCRQCTCKVCGQRIGLHHSLRKLNLVDRGVTAGR